MHVLVTGGAGFLGAYVMAALSAAGHEAFAYDLAAPDAELLGVAPALRTRFHSGSVTDPQRLLEVCRAQHIEAIVHAAGRVGLQASLADPVGFYTTNVLGCAHVCETARALSLRKLVLVSSNAAYHQPRGAQIAESDPVFSVAAANPAGHYGTSKMAAEAVAMAYADFHGMDFIGLRVTAVYGFGMRAALAVKPMVEDALRGQPTVLPSGGAMKRDYSHVLDCSEAIVRALELPALPVGTQRIFNVSAGQVYSGAQMAQLVRKLIPGARIEIGDALAPHEEATARMRAPLDSSMARRILDWAPRWGIEEGVRQYAETFRRFHRDAART